MKTAAQFEVQGSEELSELFNGLNAREQATILEKTLSSAGSVINKSMKTFAAEANDSGTLAKSIGVRARRQVKNGTAFAAVGPRRKFRGPNGQVPTRYAHLVDKGFTHRDGTKVKGINFVQRAVDATKSQVTSKIASEYARQLFMSIDRIHKRFKKKKYVF
jgi:hypothetical protein